jgi:VDE lipocalin domain
MQEPTMIPTTTATRRRSAAATATTAASSAAASLILLLSTIGATTHAFAPQQQHTTNTAFHHHYSLAPSLTRTPLILHSAKKNGQQTNDNNSVVSNKMAQILLAGILSASLLFPSTAALAENELSAKYGGGLDTSLVDQTCLVDQCSVQAKACLADDPSCRKGLTCTAKCLGDNACITGCMARYGNENLDNLLKCTIEDHECIKVAILPGGADEYGQEPRSPAPTIRNFNVNSMQGNWYKVVGYNPNYDCYACQRNSFASSGSSGNELSMNVEFSMPHLLPDGSPPPPSGARETLVSSAAPTSFLSGSQSIGLNDYSTHETMIFDKDIQQPLRFMNKNDEEVSYARTAHSEGEMFGLSKCFSVVHLLTKTLLARVHNTFKLTLYLLCFLPTNNL